jgi:hypothetical protein
LVALLSGIASFAPASAGDGPWSQALVEESLRPGFDSITERDSETILRHLVEGDMQGRGTGQEGFLLAAKWFASELERSGFEPAGPDGSWFQNVPFFKLKTEAEQCSITVGDDTLVTGRDLGINGWTGQHDSTGPVTFIRTKAERPQIAEGSLAGQLLVIQPDRRISPTDDFVLKAKPACVLIVADDARVRNEAVDPGDSAPGGIPAASVTLTAANALAVRCGLKPDFFAAGSGRRGAVPIDENQVISSSTAVRCRIAATQESTDVPNVLGWLPGSDESLRHQHIVLGAHLDHLGVQRGQLFPGADDNGSGSTAVLQVARALGANPARPKRSVLVMAFCAEERGLLGSKYYVAHPTRPVEDIVCMLNMDMVGRNEETTDEPASANEKTIHLVGSQDRSQQMHQLVLKANEPVGFEFEYDEEDRVDGRSDHASFAARDIPVAFLFDGFHPHYHQPSDSVEGMNFTKIANAARLFYLTIHAAAGHGPMTPDK